MKVTRMAIPDVCLIEPQVFGDERGFFLSSWQDASFRRDVADVTFVQDNLSRSSEGVLRGLHYQAEHTQGKLVRCVAGSVWDVAVDVRRSSDTYGAWVGTELSEANHLQLWIPAGFAHGFIVLSESADMLYKVTDRYHPQSERTVLWNDPALAIDWPIATGTTPLLSAKDAAGQLLSALDGLP